jgi:Arc/MetJ-type ribon-helix-helix transcriptional regulator
MSVDAATEKKRLNVILPERSARRLSALVKRTEATSYTDVLRNALRLYEAIVEETEQGNEVCIRARDGHVRSYRFFFTD